MAGIRTLAPRMIGRQAESRVLDEYLQQARAGAGRVVFVAGEAGVGKTCLLRDFAARAQEQGGAEILRGHCDEEDPSVPLGPFIDALRSFLRARGADALAAAAGPWRGDLARLLPELAPRPIPFGGDHDPLGQKRQLFAAIQAVVQPGSGRPCRVILLEDLHWADRTSQELVHYLARASGRERVLIVGTYRSHELSRHNPFNHLIAQLTRDRLLHEIELAPLGRDDLARMVEATLGRPLPAAAVYRLHEQTGGNPFYLEETLRALIAQGQLDTLAVGGRAGQGGELVAIPRSLKESILGRIGDLDPTTSAVLTYAAVIGRRFDFDLLLRLVQITETDLLRALATLVERQLVVEETGGWEDRYAFRHALTREAIYDDLLGRERRQKHRAVLQALEETFSSDPERAVDQLAYHSLHARELGQAARYARLAGARAVRLSAYREAVAHYAVALDLLGPGETRERADLLDTLGEAAFPLGDADLYRRYWQEAQGLYGQLGERRKVADIHRRLGRVAWEQGEMARAFAHTRDAVALLEAEPPGHELAMAYSALSQLHMLTTESREGIAWGEKALRLADQLDDPAVMTHALNNVGGCLTELGEWQRGLGYMERSLAVAKEHHLSFDTHRAYNNLGDTLILGGAYRRAAALVREGIAHAERFGWGGKQSLLLHNLGHAEMALGNWEAAHDAFDRAILFGEMGYPVARLFATPYKGELLRRQGQLTEARQMLEEVQPLCEQHAMFQVLGELWPTLAQIYLALGDTERALAAMDHAVALWRPLGPQLRAATLLGHAVDLYLATGQHERVPEPLAALATIAEDDGPARGRGCLADALGLVAAHEGRHAEAAAHFADARARWREMECPYEEARALHRRAASLLRSGDPAARDEAMQALTTARDTLTRLGAPADLAAITATLERHGLAARPTRKVTGTDALTPREREVIALLARGYSNREIAQELFISRKTTEIHVGNILSKLGCTSRAQAAVQAVAHGLVPAPDPR